MNERIRELAKQATVHGNTEHHLDIPSWYLEKFAELIVRECLTEVVDEVQYATSYELADQVANRVKKHFGVQE